MLEFLKLSIFTILSTLALNAQNVSFSPEIVLGNRSTSYQHFIGVSINDKWSINNVTLFDTEYINNTNNIFFIRNMLSYNLNENFKVNASIGIKNPGKFVTISSQYLYTKSNAKISYAIGITYQKGYILEQTLSLNYTPSLTENIKAYVNLFVVANTNLKVLDRGIQQLRFGIKQEELISGMAINLDQFKKAEKTLENFGIFIKYNF